MNKIVKAVRGIIFLILLTGVNATLFAASTSSLSATPEVQNTYKDIKATFGFVPTFMKDYPPEGITGAWELMKEVQLSANTSIPPKYKELIGLGVAAQIPCSYCVYFHTQAAKSNGATEAEIHEAIAMAGLTRYWSTFLNGVQVNETTYNSDLNQMVQFAKSKSKDSQNMTADSSSLKATYEDIQKTLGSVPQFFKLFPDFALPAAWKNMKEFYMNPNTAIPSKYKELIGLGVASQIPCSYCTITHTQFAQVNGATQNEIGEAILVAAGTRQWSTIINGLQMSEQGFQKEANQMLKFVKNKK